MESEQSSLEEGNAPAAKPTWLLVGDFLFYLRLLARQFANLGKSLTGESKNMVIVPDSSMAWEQLATGGCELVLLDCAEAKEAHFEFLRTMQANYPHIRRVVVSATLTKQMESEFMEAGADLCFSKPKSTEETASVYRLMMALAGPAGRYPTGELKGLSPARFIQFLCAKKEDGVVALQTENGPATLVLEAGQIVDATYGELQGAEAASKILSLDRTDHCHFKRMRSSHFHTVHLRTHTLWLDSDKLKLAARKLPSLARPTPPSRRLGETFAALNAMDKVSLEVAFDHEDDEPQATGTDGPFVGLRAPRDPSKTQRIF